MGVAAQPLVWTHGGNRIIQVGSRDVISTDNHRRILSFSLLWIMFLLLIEDNVPFDLCLFLRFY